MIISQAGITGLTTGFKVIFNKAFKGVTTYWPQVAMRVPSSTASEVYAWLGTFPTMRQWLGDRQIKNIDLKDYTIENLLYESTISVRRTDLEDGRAGIYEPLVSELARMAATKPDSVLFQLLKDGFSTNCYDGQYFFDTDHPVGDSTASNDGGGSGTNWFVLDLSRSVKPLIYQERDKIEFVSFKSSTDEYVFKTDSFLYGTRGRFGAGYGLWQLAYGSKDTLDSTNLKAAWEAMIGFTDDEGVNLGVMPTHLVVPPSLYWEAVDLLEKERNASGETNVLRNKLKLLMVPWLE